MNKNIVKSAYYEKLTGDVKERYDEKIVQCGGIDPYAIKPKELSTNPKDFPEITLNHLTDYMIHAISSFTKRFINNYKGVQAYKFFESDFVCKIGSKKNNETAIVKGRVKHSQRLNETPLDVWILANLDGKLICAHCNCDTGLTETCSHVGAICFAVQKISESRKTKSATEVLCKWNVPKAKGVPMSAAKDISWRSPPRNRPTHEASFVEYSDSLSSLSDERINQFLRTCHSVGDDTALGTILFPSEKKRKTKLRDEIFLASLYDENNKEKSLVELIDIGKAIPLKLSDEEVEEICKITLPRLKSKCSLGLRRGRITGSNFKNCCISNVQDASITTIKRVIAPTKNLDHIPSVKYQIQNKKRAIQQYIRNALLNHEEFLYEECGLIINPDIPFFVGTPDGLVSCTCHGEGCIQVKCLNIPELVDLDDYLTRKPNNIFNKCGNIYTLEENNEFFYQIQLQINIKDLNFCDVIIWSPQEAYVVTVYADRKFWSVEMNKALKFHKEIIMPELLGKFYTQKKNFPELNKECEDDFEVEKLELLALEIEILESEEWPDIPGSKSTDSFLSTTQAENPNQQSLTISLTELHLEQKQKHVRNSIESPQPVVEDLKLLSIKEICSTFDYHQEYLNDVYNRLIKQAKIHYYPTDLPSYAAFDLITPKQFEAMVGVAEAKLVKDAEHHNSTDVIFDAIIAEWAYKVFGKKYSFNRQQAVAAVKQMNSIETEINNL